MKTLESQIERPSINDADGLTKSMRQAIAYANGDKRKVVERFIVPDEVNVQLIREKLNLSQEDFSRNYGFPIATIKNWENGRRKPEPAARTLLMIIDAKPKILKEVGRFSA